MTAMSNEEQFDLDMLQAIRLVARHAVVLARARETIHMQRRRINEVEHLHDRRLREQQAAEGEVENLKRQVAEGRSALDGHRKEIIRLTNECDGHIQALRAVPSEIAELRAVNEALTQQVDELKKAKAELEKRLERETSPIPDVVDGHFPYKIEDVDRIEKHRGQPYPRLRATVEERNRLQSRIADALKVARAPTSKRNWADVDQALEPIEF